MTIHRQGDILLIATNETNLNGYEQLQAGEHSVILADGKATGHLHAVRNAGATLWQKIGSLNADGLAPDRILRLPSDAALTHEEHAPIALAAGDWIVRRQREYSPEALRNVED